MSDIVSPPADDDSQYAPYLLPDSGQQEASQAEAAHIASSVGILQDFFDDLEADIEAHRGIDLIDGLGYESDAEQLKMAVLLNNQVRAKLIALRDKYRIRYSQYIEDADA